MQGDSDRSEGEAAPSRERRKKVGRKRREDVPVGSSGSSADGDIEFEPEAGPSEPDVATPTSSTALAPTSSPALPLPSLSAPPSGAISSVSSSHGSFPLEVSPGMQYQDDPKPYEEPFPDTPQGGSLKEHGGMPKTYSASDLVDPRRRVVSFNIQGGEEGVTAIPDAVLLSSKGMTGRVTKKAKTPLTMDRADARLSDASPSITAQTPAIDVADLPARVSPTPTASIQHLSKRPAHRKMVAPALGSSKKKLGRQDSASSGLVYVGEQIPISTRLIDREDAQRVVCVACTAASYNMDSLKDTFMRAFPSSTFVSHDTQLEIEVAHISVPTNDWNSDADIFVFAYGSIAYWGPNEKHLWTDVIDTIAQVSNSPIEDFDCELLTWGYSKPYEMPMSTSASESDYRSVDEGYSKSKFKYRSVLHAHTHPLLNSSTFILPLRYRHPSNRIVSGLCNQRNFTPSYSIFSPKTPLLLHYSWLDQDHFYLASTEADIKLAFSHAVAQSEKLSHYEERIDDQILSTRRYPEELAAKGEVTLSGKAIARTKGQLFLHRMNIILHTDLLDTPDFFWERTDLEPLYIHARKYFEISRRVRVLNERLGVVAELFDMLHEQQKQKHSDKLEWIVIWLIVIEIVVSALTIYLKVFPIDNACGTPAPA